MIKHAIYNAFKKKRERGWDKWPSLYVVIDLHDVIIPGTYTRNNEGRTFYPDGKEVLQWFTNRKDMCLILWTSSWKKPINNILEWMEEHGIKFNYVNENPECLNTELCCFHSKFYFDLCLEDKAGFVGETDWTSIKNALIELGEWDKKETHDEKSK